MSDQKRYITRVMQLLIIPKGEPMFSEMGTTVSIADEAAGEFVEVSQCIGKIAINPEEWPALRAAINKMILRCDGGEA